MELYTRRMGDDRVYWAPARAKRLTGRWKIEVIGGTSHLYIERTRFGLKWWTHESDLRLKNPHKTYINDCNSYSRKY